MIELDPNFPEAHHILGALYRKQGRYEDAIAELERALELFGSRAWSLADLGMCYAVTGNRDKALAILRELTELYYRREALGQHVASLYAALGDKDQAFAWLERDFQAHSGFLVNIAHGPRNDVLRATLSSDPRWSDLLRRIGLTAN